MGEILAAPGLEKLLDSSREVYACAGCKRQAPSPTLTGANLPPRLQVLSTCSNSHVACSCYVQILVKRLAGTPLPVLAQLFDSVLLTPFTRERDRPTDRLTDRQSSYLTLPAHHPHLFTTSPNLPIIHCLFSFIRLCANLLTSHDPSPYRLDPVFSTATFEHIADDTAARCDQHPFLFRPLYDMN